MNNNELFSKEDMAFFKDIQAKVKAGSLSREEEKQAMGEVNEIVVKKALMALASMMQLKGADEMGGEFAFKGEHLFFRVSKKEF